MSRKSEAVERIDIPREEIAAVLERAKGALDSEVYATLEAIVRAYLCLLELVEKKGMTIQNLRSLLFGQKTEKLRNVLPEAGEEGSAESASAAGAPPGAGKPGEEKEKKAKKGHGRNAASEYTGAEDVTVSHPTLKPGDPCPDPLCKGKVYAYESLVLVRVVGAAPVGAKVIEIQQLRCNLCLTVYRAAEPEEFGKEKYDETAGAMLAVLRYGSGLPMYRIERLQENLGIPLPASTQWDILERMAELVRPAYEELIRQAAQGDVLHNDDTGVKILELMARRKDGKADDG